MILELQIKYLKNLESYYLIHLVNGKHDSFSPLCDAARLYCGEGFKEIIIRELRKDAKNPNLLPWCYWWPLNKSGLLKRLNLLRKVRRRKEALLQECNY